MRSSYVHLGIHITGKSKVGNFTNFVFTNENITSSQVSMYNLIRKRKRNVSSEGAGEDRCFWPITFPRDVQAHNTVSKVISNGMTTLVITATSLKHTRNIEFV